MIDKFKSCKDLETGEDCPDRCVQPNCHSTCEGYLHRCKIRNEIQNNRRKQNELNDFVFKVRDSRYKTGLYNRKDYMPQPKGKWS